MIRIICFNINGLRARPHQLAALKDKYDPDIIALQEIKVSDEDFPASIPEDLGFKYSWVVANENMLLKKYEKNGFTKFGKPCYELLKKY